MVFDKLRRLWLWGAATDALKRVPTGLYGPLKRAQDAIPVLLARLSFQYPNPQGFSPNQRTDSLLTTDKVYWTIYKGITILLNTELQVKADPGLCPRLLAYNGSLHNEF